MKDWDAEWAERDSDDARSFTLRGETFYRRKAIRLETLFELEQQPTGSDEETAATLDRQVLVFIEDRDGAHDRYRELRAREHDGLGLRHVVELKRWLMEEETGLPTTAPSALRNGRDTSANPSTGRSSSTAAAV